MESWLQLFDAGGNSLTLNDDSTTTSGASGSASTLDWAIVGTVRAMVRSSSEPLGDERHCRPVIRCLTGTVGYWLLAISGHSSDSAFMSALGCLADIRIGFCDVCF